MEATPATGAGSTARLDLSGFAEVSRSRRELVYNYLDAWPGAAAFKPQDIHDALFSYVRRRGKALRPLLVLLACGAAGGDEQQAVPAAAAVEIFHTWTLVHDDIIDHDDTRRGHPTVHALYRDHARREHGHSFEEASHYGIGVAILAGDLQQSWTFALLGELVERGVSPLLVVELVTRMATYLTPRLLEGEMLDVQYSFMPVETLSEDQVMHMLAMKTGALLEYAAWAGAKIGLGEQQDNDGIANKLGEFALLSGTAFQLHDDLLGLTADEGELGKPVGSDIREGKRTLIVYNALQRTSAAERQVLLSTLGRADATPADIERVLDILRSSGACDYVTNLANQYIARAQELLSMVPASRYRDLLGEWAAFLLTRRS